MLGLLRLAGAIDRLNQRLERGVGWLCLTMVLIGAWNALARYGGRFTGVELSSNAYIELQWYLFSLVFLLGAPHALRRDAHVRVDVLYGRLGPRAQATIDIAGALAFLLPFCAFGLWVSWPAVRNSWHVWEQSPDPGGLPRWPIKTMIMVSFGLVGLQGVSEVIHRIARLTGHEPLSPPATPPIGGQP